MGFFKGIYMLNTVYPVLGRISLILSMQLKRQIPLSQDFANKNWISLLKKKNAEFEF